MTRARTRILTAVAIAAVAALSACGAQHPDATTPAPTDHTATASATTTPITHLVVIYDENVSYDHYFGTYPKAANTDGVRFTAASGTPSNDNLITSGKLTRNPNLSAPKRLSSAHAVTCDQDHGYTAEQRAVNGGAMNRFVQNTAGPPCTGAYNAPGLVMDYFDGNTVTALWNYAQNFAMSDASWDPVFGPSTPGAIDLISGQTHGFTAIDPSTRAVVRSSAIVAPDAKGSGTLIADLDPAYDDCSRTKSPLALSTGTNIGTLLNAKGVTWGWFEGGFRPTATSGTKAMCGSTHKNIAGAAVTDYIPHHEPFQYAKSTANPHHLAPSSTAMIGRTDRANHQYDLRDFTAALNAGNLPAVSFLKASAYQDGHAGYSNPIDEQHFLVSQINALQKSKFWTSTAIVIAYDDSDGWYDHRAPTITNSSHTGQDAATCASSKAPVLGGFQGRCGPSQRLPLLVISPYARANSIAHGLTSQVSVLRFIEDNWRTGRVGGSSFDAASGSLLPMLNLTAASGRRVLLNANGTVASVSRVTLSG